MQSKAAQTTPKKLIRRTCPSGHGSGGSGPKWHAPLCSESLRVQLKRRVTSFRAQFSSANIFFWLFRDGTTQGYIWHTRPARINRDFGVLIGRMSKTNSSTMPSLRTRARSCDLYTVSNLVLPESIKLRLNWQTFDRSARLKRINTNLKRFTGTFEFDVIDTPTLKFFYLNGLNGHCFRSYVFPISRATVLLFL